MSELDPQKNQEQDESPYDAYGWDFHKWPLIYAAILTILFYAFIFFYMNV